MAQLRSTAYAWHCLVALAKLQRRTQQSVLEQVLVDAARAGGVDVDNMSRY